MTTDTAPAAAALRAAGPVASLSAPTKRRPQLVLGGVLCVVIAALAGAWLFSSANNEFQVLVLDVDLAAGEILEASDLRVTDVSGLVDVRAVQPHQQDLIVGLAARTAMPAGTVVNSELFAGRDQVVPAGFAVVGAATSAGAVPTGSMTPGDLVELYAVRLDAAVTNIDPEEPGASVSPLVPASVFVTDASIWVLDRNEGAGSDEVSLLVPADKAAQVAELAAAGQLWVVLVGAS